MPTSQNKTAFLLDQEALKNALKTYDLHLFTQVGSTNQYLLENANTLQHGAVCLAEEQTAGRGRRGRVWHSPLAGNIYLSQFFHYEGELPSISGLSLVVGIAIAETLARLDIADIKLKWPNDLFWQNNKLGGILLETVPLSKDKYGIVTGIGINLAMQKSKETEQIKQDWVSLTTITKKTIDKTELVIHLIQAIEKAALQFMQEGMKPFVARWLSFDNNLNQKVKLLTEQGDIVGIAKGIDEQGALLVEVDGKLVPFHSGEISLRAMD